MTDKPENPRTPIGETDHGDLVYYCAEDFDDIRDNVAAFPGRRTLYRYGPNRPDLRDESLSFPGMSLRVWLVGQVLAGPLVAHVVPAFIKDVQRGDRALLEPDSTLGDLAARTAFAVADAVLAEGER